MEVTPEFAKEIGFCLIYLVMGIVVVGFIFVNQMEKWRSIKNMDSKEIIEGNIWAIPLLQLIATIGILLCVVPIHLFISTYQGMFALLATFVVILGLIFTVYVLFTLLKMGSIMKRAGKFTSGSFTTKK